jgi:transposase
MPGLFPCGAEGSDLRSLLDVERLAGAIAKRSTMRKARVALARRLGIIMHAMLRDETEFVSA